jgi:hypothetical protein
MTVNIAQTTLLNTVDYMIDRTNELANAMSTVVVTTNSNTAVGNAAITGRFSANSFSIVGANTISINAPNTSSVEAGNYFLNANGSWSEIITPSVTTGTTNTSGLTTQTIDSFSTENHRAVEYYIHVKNNSTNTYHASKILVVHSGNSSVGGNAFSTEYATIVTNGLLGTFNASIDGANVVLRINPSVANTTINYTRVNF